MSEMHFHDGQSCWCPCDKRIAELEAELAHLKSSSPLVQEYFDLGLEVERLKAANKTLAWKVAQCTEAAEKAEAEVERLTAALKDHNCDWYGDRHGSKERA